MQASVSEISPPAVPHDSWARRWTVTACRRREVRFLLTVLSAWLFLALLDHREADPLLLQLQVSVDGTGLIHTAYIANGQERMVAHPGRHVSRGRGPVAISIPIPHPQVQTIWIRVLADSPFIDVQELTFRQRSSLFWPNRLLQRLPVEGIRANGAYPPPSPVAPEGLRFPLDDQDLTLLKIRTVNQLNGELAAPAMPLLQRTATAMALGTLFFVGWHRRRLSWTRTTACMIGILAAAAAVLLATVFLMPSPTSGADELSYMQAAYGISRMPAPSGYQRLYWSLPNFLYTGLGRLCFSFAARGEIVLQVMQVLLYLVSCGGLWFLARRWTTPGWANATVGFAALFAFHSHARYFMPETLYGVLFTGLALWWCLSVAHRPSLGVVGAGCLCAALYYVKPHALALIAAVGACCLLIPWTVDSPGIPTVVRVRRSLIGGGLFLISTLVSLVVFSYALTALKQDSTSIYNLADYTGILDLLAGRQPLSRDLVITYVRLAAAQLLLSAPYLAAPAYIAFRMWFRRRENRSEVRLLILFSALTFLATYAMTIHFTIRAAEHALSFPSIGEGLYFRAHGRYYSFTLPLFFVLFAVGMDGGHAPSPGRLRLILAVSGAVVLGGLLVAWAIPQAAVMWYDYPECYGLTTGIGQGLAVLCLLGQAMAVATSGRQGAVRAVTCALLLYTGFAAGHVFLESLQWNREQLHQTTAGRMFAGDVPETERPYTLLISPIADAEYYFTSAFRYSPIFSRTALSSIPDIDSFPPESRWLVTHQAVNPERAEHPRLTLVSRYMGYKLYAIHDEDP